MFWQKAFCFTKLDKILYLKDKRSDAVASSSIV